VVGEATFAVIMGDEKDRIRSALEDAGFKSYSEASDMKDAVEKAASSTRGEGSMVLLSPACTSWDRYPNYKERGMDFRRNVAKLAKRNVDAD
jgi:UDP-N-acetylmuramoylalanine--D-glutamate ligase